MNRLLNYLNGLPGTLTVLLFAHGDQILQDADALLHRLQLGCSPRPVVLHCLELLHHQGSKSVDVRSREATAAVLEHRQQQLVAPRLDLQHKHAAQTCELSLQASPNGLRRQVAHPRVTGVEGVSKTVQAALL